MITDWKGCGADGDFGFPKTNLNLLSFYITAKANYKLPRNFRKHFFFGEVKGRFGLASGLDRVKALKKTVHVR